MTDLFDIPESKSPRLLWMEKHGIKTRQLDFPERDYDWMAWRKRDENANGIPAISGQGDTEGDAIADLAQRLGIRLWNEEGMP